MAVKPLVLIGLPGSGKSSVSDVVGRLTGRPVLGLDSLIEAEAGTSISRIFAEDGEDRFRRLESALLDRVLDEQPDAVIDGGGGLVLRRRNREALARSAVTIWLDAPDAVLAARLGPADDRPLLADDPPARLRA
ncbi:MAG: shikimate kinase, partial [Acidimicrobiales bacterium]